jgi:predicted PurR-regulated permease PerM
MIRKFLVDVFHNAGAANVADILHASQSVSQSFIAGLMIQMIIVFILNAAGFLILGIKYAIFLALISAILNLIPYIGMLVANVFSMLITMISSEVMHVNDVIWVGVILATVQFIDNNFLMSFVVGSKVRLNALVTIIGILIGGALCGITGMFLSIPAMAVLKVIFDRVDELKPYGMLFGDDCMTINKGRGSRK